MSKIIAGILIAGAGSLVVSIGFSDTCSNEILAKVSPFIGTLPGLIFAWVSHVTGQNLTFLGKKKD